MAGLNGTPRNGWAGAHESEANVPDPTSGDEVVDPGGELDRSWSGLLPDEVSNGDLELEHARLEAEIAAARARVAIAKHRSAEVSAALRAEVLASQEQLAEMERAHVEAVAEIQRSAKEQAAAVLAAARRDAASVAASVDSDVSSEVQQHGQ